MRPQDRRASKALAKDDRARLALQYPDLFSAPGAKEPKLPIAARALRVLRDRGVNDDEGGSISKTRLRRAVALYMRGARYARGLLHHDHYFDLDGTETQIPIGRAAREEARHRLHRWDEDMAARAERAAARDDIGWGYLDRRGAGPGQREADAA